MNSISFHLCDSITSFINAPYVVVNIKTCTYFGRFADEHLVLWCSRCPATVMMLSRFSSCLFQDLSVSVQTALVYLTLNYFLRCKGVSFLLSYFDSASDESFSGQSIPSMCSQLWIVCNVMPWYSQGCWERTHTGPIIPFSAGVTVSLEVSESPGSIQVARGQTAVLPCAFSTSAALINLNVIWMVIPLSNANQPEQVLLSPHPQNCGSLRKRGWGKHCGNVWFQE